MRDPAKFFVEAFGIAARHSIEYKGRSSLLPERVEDFFVLSPELCGG